MEQKTKETYIDESLGFPVVLKNVPMKKVRDEWIVDVDPERLQRVVLRALIQKPGPLTGNEVRFMRQWLELTLTEFGNLFGVTHPAVVNWEQQGDSPTNMANAIDTLLRLRVFAELPDQIWENTDYAGPDGKTRFTRDRLRKLLQELSSLEREAPVEHIEIPGSEVSSAKVPA